MALHQSNPQSAAGRTSSPSIQQREEAATQRERALAGEVERLSTQRAAMQVQVEAMERDAENAEILMQPVEMPEAALEPVLGAIAQVREDALRQRAEAAEMLEKRLDEMRRGLAHAAEELRAGAAEIKRARAEAEAEARRERASRRAEAELSEAPSLGDAMISSLPQLAAKAQVQMNGQRRAAQRVNLVAQVDLSSDTNFFNGFSSDISAGGLFITTCEDAPIGSHVQLKFTIPGGIEIEAEGEVRWVRELSDVQPELLPGVGVSFTAINPDSVRAIERFVSERDPIFFPDA